MLVIFHFLPCLSLGKDCHLRSRSPIPHPGSRALLLEGEDVLDLSNSRSDLQQHCLPSLQVLTTQASDVVIVVLDNALVQS